MRVVLRLGGSVLVPSDIDEEFLSHFVSQVEKVHIKHEVLLEVGSGRLSRTYIEAAKRLGATNTISDSIGIEISRLNALLLIATLKDAYPYVVREFPEAAQALALGKIPVLGGTHPGHTNDAVAVMLAEYVRADVIVKITDVSGIYTKDPKTHKDAELISRMSFSDLKGFVFEEFSAGRSSIIDPLASKIIAQSKIKMYVVGARDAENLSRLISGNHNGTTIEG
jgi:uridylate kinase